MSQCEAAESNSQVNPQVIDGEKRSPLDEVLRQGALQMLVKAVEAEVAAYIETHQHEVDQDGRRLVVRNGHARERTIVSGVGQLKLQAPRVDDRRVDEQGQRFHFTSQILPHYLRRTKSIEELIPWLYLKGIATGDFSEALEALQRAVARFLRNHPGVPEIEPPPEGPWRYGTLALDSAEGQVSGFREFGHWQGERLQHGVILPSRHGGRASLAARSGAPGDDLTAAVTRRWVSPIGGRVSIQGTLNHPMSDQARRFGYSNGIRGWVISGRQGVIARWTIAGMQVATDIERLTVEPRETIDFVADSRGDYESDDFTWAPVIEEMLTLEQKQAGEKARRWSAADDFRLPQEKSLSPWEQYAQVLLMTNEFAFVD